MWVQGGSGAFGGDGGGGILCLIEGFLVVVDL